MNRIVAVVLGVVAIILGSIFLTRTTPSSTSGGGAGLKTGPLVVSRAEPVKVSVTPVPAAPPHTSQSEAPLTALTPPSRQSPAPSAGQIAPVAPKTTDMNLNGQQYHLLVADKSGEWELGLMNRTSLPGFDGMAFVFPTVEPRTFWNKNTHLNLIVIWAHGINVLGVTALPSIDRTKTPKFVTSPEPVDRVIELVVR